MKRRKFLKWLSAGTLTALVGGVGWSQYKRKTNPYYTGPVSDHYNGLSFFNPEGAAPGSFTNLLKWKFQEERAEWPDEYPSPYANAKPQAKVDGADIKVTMIGHATLLIQTNGLNIITDPVYSKRVSPFQFAGPKRHNPPGIAFNDLPKIDIILVSHNHYDHLDLLTLEKLVKRDNPKIITPLGNDTIIHGSVDNADIEIGDWGDIVEISDTKIYFEPCHHWSARGTKDRRMALWSAFVIETPERKIYHIGDTGFHDGINFKSAAEKHTRFDLTIMPVGAYEPRWFMKGQHQNPAEAVEGFKLCKTEYALGHHWGTFQLTNEAIEQPKIDLTKALKDQGIPENRFLAMAPGQTWSMNA